MLLGERRLQLSQVRRMAVMPRLGRQAAAGQLEDLEGRDGFGRTGRGEGAGETRAGRPAHHLLYSRISNGDYPRTATVRTTLSEFGVSRPVLQPGAAPRTGLSIRGSRGELRPEVNCAAGFRVGWTIADIQRCYEFGSASYLASCRGGAAEQKRWGDRDGTVVMWRATSRPQTRTCLTAIPAANNQYFEASMRALREHIFVGMKLHGQSLMTDGAKALRNVFGEHSAIFDAIRDGNGEQAAELMNTHLVHSRDRLFGGALIDLGRG
jgi:GntR family transcriptional repressor for pyruvate dehydrogenase complex